MVSFHPNQIAMRTAMLALARAEGAQHPAAIVNVVMERTGHRRADEESFNELIQAIQLAGRLDPENEAAVHAIFDENDLLTVLVPNDISELLCGAQQPEGFIRAADHPAPFLCAWPAGHPGDEHEGLDDGYHFRWINVPGGMNNRFFHNRRPECAMGTCLE